MDSRTVGQLEFLFLLVDASTYATDEWTVNWSCRKHLAGGKVTAELSAEITDKLNRLRNGQGVDDAKLADYSQAIKILLVHYAVDTWLIARGADVPLNLILPHECEGLDVLVRDLGSDLRLVLHGHMHYPKL